MHKTQIMNTKDYKQHSANDPMTDFIIDDHNFEPLGSIHQLMPS